MTIASFLLFFILVPLYFLACIILIAVILIQSGKGGGLSSLGAASQGISDAFGTTGAEKTLNKGTTYAAVGFMVIAILITLIGRFQTGDTTILGDTRPAASGQQTPGAGGAPATAPAGAGQAAQPVQPESPAPAQPAAGK